MNQSIPSGKSALAGPLHIDSLTLVSAPSTAGVLGMTHCPGRSTPDRLGRLWQRNVTQDVAAIDEAGFGTVLSLVNDDELAALGASQLRQCLRDAGVHSLQFPISDFGVPDKQSQPAWRLLQSDLLARLLAGGSVLVHCAAGLGRTGTMVAVLLKAFGEPADQAIGRVRSVRPGTIETEEQADFVRRFQP